LKGKLLENLHINLNPKQIEQLEFYSNYLDKDVNTIFNEALNYYFDAQEKLIAQSENSYSPGTNLDYNEFWDGIDLD
jgi:hypothetical protein